MATALPPLFRNIFSLLLFLFLHLGCFTLTTFKTHTNKYLKTKKPHKPLSSSWSFLKHLFSSKNTPISHDPNSNPNPSIGSPCSSTKSSIFSNAFISHVKTRTGSFSESDMSDTRLFPLCNDIYPCPVCGKIFHRPGNLENHQFFHNAVSELIDGDSGKNIVSIIFNRGWTNVTKNPVIHRVLKIHNSPKILTRFEEYRELVKNKAARNGVVRKRDERCIADGNELLRFHCAMFLCELGQNGDSGLCGQQFCSICGILKSGFLDKMDGIATGSTSWRAHLAIPEDVEEEFSFINAKRAVLVCRVIAGRVGCDPDVVDKEDPGYDSLVGRGAGGGMDDEDELLVFNPRAVLPCFVIVYTV